MFSQIRSLSAPPIFEDEEKTRLARLLHQLLLITFVLNILNVTLLAVLAPDTFPPFWINGLLFVGSAIAFWLMREGRIRAGSLVQCVALWVLLSYYLTFSGGIAAPALGLFNIVIIIGGVLLGESGAITFGLLCIVSTFISYWATSAGWLDIVQGTLAPTRIFATYVTIFVSVAVLMGMSGRSVHQALTRARRSEATLVERNRQLERQITARQQVEEAYGVLVEHSAQGFIIVQNNQFVFANPRMCQILGYTIQEFLAIEDFMVLVHPEERALVSENMHRRLAGEDLPSQYELRALHKSGQVIWLEVFVTLITYLGSPAVQTAVIDISERKKAEEALRESEERYRITTELISDLTYSYRVEPDGTFAPEWMTHDATKQVFGFTVDEIATPFIRYHPDDQERARQDVQATIQGQQTSAEYRILAKDGSFRWLQASRYPVWDAEQKRVVRFYGVGKDVTERKRAEEALQESELRFRLVAQATNDVIWDCNLLTNEQWWNDVIYTSFGYSPGQVGSDGTWWREQIHPDDRDAVISSLDIIRTGTQFWSYEYRFRRGDGSYAYVVDRALVDRDDTGKAVRMIGSMMDITERKRTEEALRRSEERFSKAFHSSPIPITISTATDGRVIDVNESCLTALGFERREMIGQTALELQLWVDSADREDILRLLQEQGTIRQREIRFRTKTGELRYALGSFEIIELNAERCLLMFWTDITERFQAEQALKQSEERFYKTFHANPLAITLNTFDEGRIVDVNDSFLRLFGYAREEMIGHTTVDLNLWDDNRERLALIDLLRERGTLRQVQTKVRTKSGEVCPILLSVEVIEIGGHEHLLGMLQDISEIKHAEEVEREQRQFAEALRDIAAALNSTLDLEAVLDQILTHVAHVVPYDASTIMLIDGNEARVVRSKGFTERGVEQKVKELRFPVDPTYISSQDTKAKPLSIIEDTQTHQGWIDVPELRWIRSVVSAPIQTGNEVIGYLDLIYATPGAFTTPRAERLQAFASQASTAIHNAQLFEQLRRLTQEMVSVQEEERRRISRELHDEAGQALIALKMSLEAVKQFPPLEMEAIYTRLADAIRLTDTTMELIRLLAQNLRPAVLDTLGLHLALQSHCHDFARRTGLNVTYTGTDIPHLPDAITTGLYRFVQEALTNVAKHSKATRVRVDLQFDASIIRLWVEDNGQGLDFQAMSSSHKHGVGLIGMQERLRSVNGWLEINPAPIHGLRLLACIPWEAEL